MQNALGFDLREGKGKFQFGNRMVALVAPEKAFADNAQIIGHFQNGRDRHGVRDAELLTFLKRTILPIR